MPDLTLDNLSDLSFEQLDALYRAGSVPADLSVLDNKPKGRMLAVRGVDKTPLAGILRAAAKLPIFPWDGKTLTSEDKQSGSGINRVQLGVSMDWFAFKTRVEPSVVDGADTIVLDYEQWVQAYRSDRFTGFGLDAGDILWKSSFLPATPVQ